MHEFAICQQLIQQVTRIAAEHGGAQVDRIIVQAGALSGVEPHLLKQAFSVARAGTVAAEAALEFENRPIIVKCRACGSESEVPVNRLLCSSCEDWKVDVIQGEELILKSIELAVADDLSTSEDEAPSPEQMHHV